MPKGHPFYNLFLAINKYHTLIIYAANNIDNIEGINEKCFAIDSDLWQKAIYELKTNFNINNVQIIFNNASILLVNTKQSLDRLQSNNAVFNSEKMVNYALLYSATKGDFMTLYNSFQKMTGLSLKSNNIPIKTNTYNLGLNTEQLEEIYNDLAGRFFSKNDTKDDFINSLSGKPIKNKILWFKKNELAYFINKLLAARIKYGLKDYRKPWVMAYNCYSDKYDNNKLSKINSEMISGSKGYPKEHEIIDNVILKVHKMYKKKKSGKKRQSK